MLLNVQDVAESCTCSITCVLYGHIGTIHKFSDYQVYLIFLVSLQVHAKAHFGTMTKCVDYAGVLIFKYAA